MTAAWTNEQDARLIAGGKTLEYACWGPPPDKAMTLVLLHEGLGSVALWRDLPKRLVAATGLGVLAYSRAGYGASDSTDLPRPLDYQTREATEVLGGVLDELGVQQTILIGHSDGGTIAAIYAGSVSDMRVRGLILIAPHFFTEPTGLATIAAAGRTYQTGDLKTRLAPYHANPDVAFWGWHDAWMDPDFAEWNVADVIDHWRIPVLAVQGRDDPYGTLAQIDEIDTRIYSPFEALVLDNCGHAPHLEYPAETDAAIFEFCNRLGRIEQADVRVG
ncbi:alpha/beta fold hydrolase [Sulfitobacter sp. MF3-043]|uniref:alpha/beta fold hydrolase n=1 Tax=Sulfitobacter sediminivivens TaxID=3252902 RepID=UPI0036D8608B